MIVTRRGLLGMFAAGTGAAVLSSGIIMPIHPPIYVPTSIIDNGHSALHWIDLEKFIHLTERKIAEALLLTTDQLYQPYRVLSHDKHIT